MKLTHALSWITVVTLAACHGEPNPVATVGGIHKQGGETMKNVTALQREKREPYGDSIERKLQELFMQIRILKTEAMARGGTFDDVLWTAAEAVEKKAIDLRNRIGKLETGAAGQWKAMLEEIDAAMEELEKASDQVVTQFAA